MTFILIGVIISACNTVRRVPKGKQLLTKNEILVNNKVKKEETIINQLYQKPNSKILGYRLRLNLFNLANPNPDSTYQAKFANHPGKYERMSKLLSAKQVDRLGKSFWYHGIHDFLKKTGEPPVIIDSAKTEKSIVRLKYYYFNEGYFNVKANYKLDSLDVKKAKVKYTITTGNPYLLDSIKTNIQTQVLDSMYKATIANSFLKSGKQYKKQDFDNEKNRITSHFRNNGVYHFQPNNITFDIDTLNTKNKANISLNISDHSYQKNDSTITEPFKVFKISDVNIYTDYSPAKNNLPITDSTSFNNFNLYSHAKLKYKPRAITDAVFITKGDLFADNKTVLTSRYLNNLKIFSYPPAILYEVDKRDPSAQSLIAKIYLTPREKNSLGWTTDITHSNIQTVGIALSLSRTIRNVFNGAETLEISGRGNIGSSKDLANPNNSFFNVSEYGIDLKLNIPRIWFPFNTKKIIPKSMIPSTLISAGLSSQRNIGLNKENLTGSFSYNWTPKKNNTARFDLLNIQYVRNLNPANYFRVYKSSYTALNNLGKTYNTNHPEYFDSDGNLKIEDGTSGFSNDVLGANPTVFPSTADYKTINSIEERRVRLAEDDFIFATNFTFSKTTKTDPQDNNYYLFKTKIESAGSLLSLISAASSLPKNQKGNYEIFNLEYSEYIKTEFDYIKHWDLSKEKVFALRTFFGIAIPFGNSNNIPFSKSYFSGGSNDNRAWQPYSLGPGSSGGSNDFNEANMKIALSGEFRFKIINSLKGALFVDAGNIWNVLDNVTDEESTFKNLKDLKKIALGSGFGLRYDFNFFVVRFDLGFKTYNPANDKANRWFNEYDFANSVFNFGINYPF